RGNYRFDVFDGLRTGNYRVVEVVQGGWSTTTTNPRNVNIPRGETFLDVDFGNALTGGGARRSPSGNEGDPGAGTVSSLTTEVSPPVVDSGDLGVAARLLSDNGQTAPAPDQAESRPSDPAVVLPDLTSLPAHFGEDTSALVDLSTAPPTGKSEAVTQEATFPDQVENGLTAADSYFA